MSTAKRSEKEPEAPAISTWMSGTVTLYPRHGAPRKLSFPCTEETQSLLQRLEQEQIKSQKTSPRRGPH